MFHRASNNTANYLKRGGTQQRGNWLYNIVAKRHQHLTYLRANSRGKTNIAIEETHGNVHDVALLLKDLDANNRIRRDNFVDNQASNELIWIPSHTELGSFHIHRLMGERKGETGVITIAALAFAKGKVLRTCASFRDTASKQT